MKKYELKLALAATEDENKHLKAHINDLSKVIDKDTKTRIEKDQEINRLENRIKELETTIRVLQNL